MNRYTGYLLLSILLMALFVSGSLSISCIYNGKDYSIFTNKTGSYTFDNESEGTVYSWNICQASYECNRVLGTTGIEVCDLNAKLSIGSTDKYYWSSIPNGGIGAMVTYVSHDPPCDATGLPRSTQVKLECGTNHDIQVVSAGVLPSSGNCFYVVVMRSFFACPPNYLSSTTSTTYTSATSATSATSGTSASPTTTSGGSSASASSGTTTSGSSGSTSSTSGLQY